MAKKKTEKKTTRKANVAKVEAKTEQKPKQKNIKTKYGHIISAQSGYIDIELDKGKSVKQIINGWNKLHPEKPMTDGRVVGHVKHLVADCGLDRASVQTILDVKKKS